MCSLKCSSSLATVTAGPVDEASKGTSHSGEIVIGGRVYLTTKRLAALLGKSPRTIARWNSVGTGPPKIRIGKLILFNVVKLQDWLEAFEMEPVRVPARQRLRRGPTRLR